MAVPDPPTVPQARRQAALALRPVMVPLFVRTTSMLALLTCAYYVWPTRSPADDTASAMRLVGALLAAALVAVVAVAERRAVSRSARPLMTIEALLTFLYFLIIVFASVYYAMARTTDQISGLETKTDGLYFTITIVSTVGFGDIHAAGTAARALVTVQMLFSIIYIGTAIRLLSGISSRIVSLPGEPGRPQA